MLKNNQRETVKTTSFIIGFLLKRPQRRGEYAAGYQCLTQSLGRLEQLRLHVNLAELSHAATQLEQRLHAVQDTHVREPNLLDKLQL